MTLEVVTGNHAAGYALAAAGEANREGRGACCGIYPITPQTEIVEYVAGFRFTKARVIPVESEHSAMGVCIGASLSGARTFTASSSNGLAYMVENIFTAGYFRLPIVMVGVNRTLGPPWNIWVDQGDTLMFRDAAWIQLYCETNQEILDSVLLAFRLAEDPRILLPVLVSLDAFILSHTQMNTELPEQELVDRFLPLCEVPHRMTYDRPTTMGGLAWPADNMSMRKEIHDAFTRVPEVYEEHRREFERCFGRDPGGLFSGHRLEDAELVLIASGTVATTVRNLVDEARAAGRRAGMIKVKSFRPFPGREILEACGGARKIGVLDRNYSSGAGGIFCQELRAATLGAPRQPLIQGYLTGLCGGDVTPAVIARILEDLAGREAAGEPVWEGIEG